ncbi:endospore germination permease [Paenibacillus sp. GCM10027627]|uniref:GerAB/ArcD/ProY family transporter n=1 Tax=unclassified Paenibacillus TaxID=185978 RepID=UPI0036363E37
MLERGKLSALQLGSIMYLTVIATSMMGAPSFAHNQAGNDMWMAPIVGSLPVFALIGILLSLHRLYPGKSLIQYSQDILGKWLGNAINVVFLLTCMLQSSNQARQFGELMNQFFFKKTPLAVVICSLVIVCVFAARLGAEVIGRAALLFMPFVLLIVLIFFMPFFKDVDPDRVLPFFHNGVAPVVRGSFYLQIWLPMYVYISYFLPFLSDEKNAAKRCLQSLIATVITLTSVLLFILFILGEATSSYELPFMVLARYLSMFDFLEQFDAVIMVFWVMNVFIRTIVTLYTLSIGFAQMLRLSDYRPLVFPVGLLVIAVSFWGTPSIADLFAASPHMSFLFFGAYVLIPFLLFLVAKIRNWGKSGSSKSKQPQSPAAQEG